jgi:hypothetical protein
VSRLAAFSWVLVILQVGKLVQLLYFEYPAVLMAVSSAIAASVSTGDSALKSTF